VKMVVPSPASWWFKSRTGKAPLMAGKTQGAQYEGRRGAVNGCFHRSTKLPPGAAAPARK